jgi:flavin reductase (DIM6/NTAB) family NADH-FMN oxidoreductase RutF
MRSCRIVKPPRVAASPIHLECRLHCALALPGNAFDQVHHVVIGRVVGVHIRDDALTSEGKVDVLRIRPLARLGYFDYTTVDSVFTMPPCGANMKAREAGLEGRPSRSGRDV